MPASSSPPVDEAPAQSRSGTSFAELLLLLLGVEHSGLHVTPGFARWLAPGTPASWPPADGGMWLLDTRDVAARRHDLAQNAGFDVALVLAGSGPPGSALRRLLRRIRRRQRPRLRAETVAPSLERIADVHLHRFAFNEGPELPTRFEVTRGSAATGTAFLLTRGEPFQGACWRWLQEQLGTTALEVLAFELRARGAVIVQLVADSRPLMVRLVAEGPLQEVVLRNHTALEGLRRALAGTGLLARMPEPLFAGRVGTVAVLGESFLRGRLAWQVATPERNAQLHGGAVAILEQLREATARSVPGTDVELAELLREDRDRIEHARFASPSVRATLADELRAAEAVLAGRDLAVCTSHGDFGYGNLLADPANGEITGIIDWDTAREADFPGIDRVNLEIQIQRASGRTFADAVRRVWSDGCAHDALAGGTGSREARALFGLAVCRYVTRAMRYPALYPGEEPGFARALTWLRHTAH